MQNNVRKNSSFTCFLMLLFLSLLTGCGGGGLWLEVYENGEYLFMWDDGYGSAGDYAIEGTLLLQTGSRFTYDSSSDQIRSEDYVMFRSQMPEHLRQGGR